MDLKTLWDRLNDAVDTIIRRDDNNESKSRDLLQPCIEGALNLPFLFHNFFLSVFNMTRKFCFSTSLLVILHSVTFDIVVIVLL